MLVRCLRTFSPLNPVYIQWPSLGPPATSFNAAGGDKLPVMCRTATRPSKHRRQVVPRPADDL